MPNVLHGIIGSARPPTTYSYSVAGAGGTGENLIAYAITSGTGFGTKYAAPATAAPTGLLAESNSNSTAFAGATGTAPYIYAYQWLSTGWGTKYTAPSTTGTNALNGLAFTSDNAYSVHAYDNASVASGLGIYPWTDASGFGTRGTNASLGATAGATDVRVTSDNNYVLATLDGTEKVVAYPLSSGAYGTKVTAPSTIPTFASANDLTITSGNSHVYLGYSTVTWTSTWTGTGWGSVVSNPSPLPPSGQYRNESHPSGNYAGFGGSSSPYLDIYAWSNGWGTKVSNPGTVLTTTVDGFRWTKNGNDIIACLRVSPFIAGYAWSNGFGTKYANPATLPAGYLREITTFALPV